MRKNSVKSVSEELQDVDLASVVTTPGSTEWHFENRRLKSFRLPPSSQLGLHVGFVTALNLSNNQLESLRGIAAFTSLEVLDASYNRICLADINTMLDITKLTRLCSVDLSHNEIQRMELEEFGVISSSRRQRLQSSATRLTLLDLSYNKLMKLPDVRLAPSLEVLYLNNNLIEDLSDIENKLALNHLHTLHLAGNRIGVVHQMVPLAALSPTLHYLTISGNPFARAASSAVSNTRSVAPHADASFSAGRVVSSFSCRWWRPLLLWLSPLLLSIDKVEFSPSECKVAAQIFREKGTLSKHLMELLNPSEKNKLPNYMAQICGFQSLLPEEEEQFLCDDECSFTISPATSPTLKAGRERKPSLPLKSDDKLPRLSEGGNNSSGAANIHLLNPISTSLSQKDEGNDHGPLHFGEGETFHISSPVLAAVNETQSLEDKDRMEEKIEVRDTRKMRQDHSDSHSGRQKTDAISARREPSAKETRSSGLMLSDEYSSPALPVFTEGSGASKFFKDTSGATLAMPIMYSTTPENTSGFMPTGPSLAISGNIPTVIKAMQSKLKTLSSVVEELWKADMVRRIHAATVIQKYVRGMLVRCHLRPEDAESCRFIRSQLSRQTSTLHVAALADAVIQRCRTLTGEPVSEGKVSSDSHSTREVGHFNQTSSAANQNFVLSKGSAETSHENDVSGGLKEVLDNMRNLQKVITTMWKDLEPFRKMAARERHRAAVTIQRYYRGYTARARYRGMREKYQAFVYSLLPLVEVLQRCGRAMMSRRRLGREVVTEHRIQSLEEEVMDLRILFQSRFDEMEATMRKFLLPPQHREGVR